MIASKSLIVLAALATAAPAWAQGTMPPADTGTTPDRSSTAAQGASGETLSSKLSKSGGVITPKTDMDNDIHVPAPDPHPNSTPVIPPAATGGNTAK